MNSAPSRRRLLWLDMGKGLGMLLVVSGHALAPGRTITYLFHVPFFAVLSGFVYHSDKPFGKYFWQKFSTLYLPFVGWNLIIRLIRLLYALPTLSPPLEPHLMLRAEGDLRILLTLNKDGDYLGATWFLGSLFVVSIVYKLVDMIIPFFRGKQFLLTAIFGIGAACAIHWTLPYLQSRTVILGFFFAFGQLLSYYRESLKRFATLSFGFLMFALLLVLSNFTYPGLSTNEFGGHPEIFMLCAILGSCACICFLVSLEHFRLGLWNPFRWILHIIGRFSIDIMIWHIIAFRLVVLFQLIQEGAPIFPTFPAETRYHSDGMWWLAYTIVGILVPIWWSKFLHIGPWGYLLKKLHLIN